MIQKFSLEDSGIKFEFSIGKNCSFLIEDINNKIRITEKRLMLSLFNAIIDSKCYIDSKNDFEFEYISDNYFTIRFESKLIECKQYYAELKEYIYTMRVILHAN